MASGQRRDQEGRRKGGGLEATKGGARKAQGFATGQFTGEENTKNQSGKNKAKTIQQLPGENVGGDIEHELVSQQ